ncbi:MAG: FAD-dependent oxidoreductase [Deltaproteobacteria bacterium]|nr:FAD-dependent oxidoreductase [Deltaproteobacteria bacterium]
MQGKKTETQVAIIGGGIMGVAVARELSKYHVDVCLVEKEAGIGFGITKGSLGVLHSALGLSSSKLVKWWDSSGDLKTYLGQPLRLKEKLNIAGHRMFLELEPQLNAKIHKCGRIMVARDEKDLNVLRIIKEVSKEKEGVELELLDKKALEEKEPALDSKFIGGLFDPHEYSVFPTEWAIAFAENARDNGVHILLETEILDIEEKKNTFRLKTNRGTIESRFVINAAGLYSDKIAKMIDSIDWSFILWKNELLILENRNYLNHIVSEVIKPQQPRVMVPTPEVNIECGVVMTLSDDKRDVSATREGLEQMAAYPSFYVPGMSFKKDIIKYFVGYMHFNSRNPDDYLVEWPRKTFLNLISCAPGIAPSAAIAMDVVKELGERGLELDRKSDFNPYRVKEQKFIELPADIKNEKIRENPRCGHIICRCEKTSEQEIREAITQGARTLDEIKFKTWIGMGRCQGGFCTSRVLKIMSEELGVSPLQLKQKGDRSYILKSETKKMV